MNEKTQKKKKKRRGAPRKLRFTREGRVFVLVTLGVGAAAPTPQVAAASFDWASRRKRLGSTSGIIA